MKRLFIAIKFNFPNGIIKEFEYIKLLFSGEKIKWVNFNQIHLTLKFLGDTNENLIPNIIDSLKNISKNSHSFNLDIQGIGVFHNFKILRVLWIGIKKNNFLNKLHSDIDINLSLLGIKSDKREFNPHITLGRIKYIKNRKKFIDFILKNSSKKFINLKIKEFYLIESILRKEGPTYIDIEKFLLIK